MQLVQAMKRAGREWMALGGGVRGQGALDGRMGNMDGQTGRSFRLHDIRFHELAARVATRPRAIRRQGADASSKISVILGNAAGP